MLNFVNCPGGMSDTVSVELGVSLLHISILQGILLLDSRAWVIFATLSIFQGVCLLHLQLFRGISDTRSLNDA